MFSRTNIPVFRRFLNTNIDPEKLTRGQRFKNYMKLIVDDYATVGKETVQDIKAKPLKSAFIFSLLGTSGYMIKTRPNKQDFITTLVSNTDELLLVGDLTRNPVSNAKMEEINKLNKEGRLRFFNLGVCTIVWFANFSREVDLYETQCKHLKPAFLDRFNTRFVDVGVAGHWFNLEKYMIDFDINSTEWPVIEESKTKIAA
ncbi:unnamed protein product [Owenia fusiformis]|uniref:Uncharacterized protein n=1 Tax=Owenia fusiformis TaxID=6347 RepID=A0A8J1Y1R3_OWEFU|nr:unnamed protein product [Owenia fusiformis]